MRSECDAHAARIPGSNAVDMRTRCNVTGRYGTERKNHQDTDENSRFPDRSTPVDNRESIVEKVA